MIQKIPDLKDANAFMENTLIEHLGIEILEIQKDFIRASMPVDERTVQPMGLLHGGASLALAESLGSFGSTLCIDLSTQAAVGLEISANHLRSVRKGMVYGTARLLHFGRRTHLWETRIEDEDGRTVCLSKLTVMIIDKK